MFFHRRTNSLNAASRIFGCFCGFARRYDLASRIFGCFCGLRRRFTAQ